MEFETQISPGAGWYFEDEVVIFENQEAKSTGAQSLAPDHAPRQPHQERPLPRHSALQQGVDAASLQRRVEQLLFQQSELLDGKHWGAYIDLFEDDGIYWMPVTPEQTEWLDSPAAGESEITVRSRFHMVELRRDNLRHFAGTYRHTLKVHGDEFKIALQRVDLLNAQAPFDYVLQIWV